MFLFWSAIASAATWNIPGDFSTITNGIAGATAGDTLVVGAGTYDESPTVTKDLTIRGVGPTTIVAGTFTIDINVDATIAELRVDPTAGITPAAAQRGFVLDSAALHLIDVETANTVIPNDGLGGGAILVIDSDLLVEDSVFGAGTQAVTDWGAHLMQWRSDVRFVNSIFHTGGGSYGGSMHLDGGTLVIEGGTLTGNTSSHFGGAIFAHSNTVVELYDVTLDKNDTGTGRGGAIYLEGGADLTADGCRFEGNTAAHGGHVAAQSGAAGISIVNSQFLDGISTGQGGALRLGATPTTIQGSLFESNTSSTAGGHVWAQGAALTVETSRFVGGTANAGGGIWFNGQAAHALGVSDSLFENNDATNGNGGGIYLMGTTSTIERNQFCDNDATGGTGLGGGIHHSSAIATLANNIFVMGDGLTNGGGVDFDGASSGSVVNNTFLDNGATNQGAALRLNDGTLTVTNNLFGWNRTAPALQQNIGVITGGFNAFYMNADTHNTAVTDDVVLVVDPGLVDYTTGTCGADLRLLTGSPLVNTGDPTILDADNSRSDIGAYGGPGGDDTVWVDGDGDGWPGPLDCDDTDAAVNADALEVCNGVDDDCDGASDEDDDDLDLTTMNTYYADIDGDFFGDPNASYRACSGGVSDDRDCDDTDAAVNPAAAEVCNGIDDDCDTLVDGDDSNVDMGTAGDWFNDGDGDGYGDPANVVRSCSIPSGRVLDNTDCNDGDGSVNPGATEVCGGVDEDCDTLIDDADPDVDPTGTFWYADADTDGYGDASSFQEVCSRPVGMVASNTDCDDANGAVHPGADEVCNGIDDDCNGLVDQADPGVDIGSQPSWYRDLDGDGFGDPASGQLSCSKPAGRVLDNTDCDDTNSAINPLGDEVCNAGVDDDCDTLVDDADPSVDPSTQSPWYADSDGDNYGNPLDAALACAQPSGRVAVNTDCDDTEITVNPAAIEVCNNVDDNCDGLIDDADSGVDTSGGSLFYADTDGDGYGDPNASTRACAAPADHVADNTDCDDTRAVSHPGATEICDNLDNDCDNTVDDGTQSIPWFRDTDGDGWGDPTDSLSQCTQPGGYVERGGDCDESNAAINPAIPDICDGVDNDCTGLVDDNPTDGTTYWPDFDGDGFGGQPPTVACAQPTDHVTNDGDCNDTRSEVNPTALEYCDQLDNDCNGLVDDFALDSVAYFADTDQDGHGDIQAVVSSCNPPAGYVTSSDDCDDNQAATYPGATELCDSADNDCDALVDEGAGTSWFADGDGDGFGDPTAEVRSCLQPSGYVTDATDCNDLLPDVHPGAIEIWYDGTDQDCDGNDDDQDEDGASIDDDCDDADPTVQESCDPVLPGKSGRTPDGDPVDPNDVDTLKGTVGCGCDSGSGLSGMWLLAGLVVLRRSRRDA